MSFVKLGADALNCISIGGLESRMVPHGVEIGIDVGSADDRTDRPRLRGKRERLLNVILGHREVRASERGARFEFLGRLCG